LRQILSDNGLTQTHLIIQGDELITLDTTPGNRVQKILDANQRLRSDTKNPLSHGRLAASIDPVLRHQWRKEWAQKHSDKWSWKTYLVMQLNPRDYSQFRTQDSTIGLTSQDKA